MKPKPFWALNHLTVPVCIVFPFARNARGRTAPIKASAVGWYRCPEEVSWAYRDVANTARAKSVGRNSMLAFSSPIVFLLSRLSERRDMRRSDGAVEDDR